MTVIIPEDGGAVRFRRGAEGVRTAGAGVEPWVQAVKSKDKHILYLARSLKTRSAFQGIWNSLDHFSLPYRV